MAAWNGPQPEQASETEAEAWSQPEPEPWVEPEPWTEPEVPAPAAGGPEDIPWPERGESTQVMPTSWTPAVPLPRPNEGQGELDPRTGDVRTTLGGDQAEAEEAANANTAEQAVPWLIGVILLLAGMVIVLLALIFAGDGSVGGAGVIPSGSALASATPERTTAATPTPASTASEAPSTSAEPSGTPVAAPQFGPLEMVYQGRSAALAPIYLLRRDFTTDEEALVLAQDPNLDVNRFAWSPDGSVGAGLYADLLVSIEPGDAKRPLGDGMSAITFGDDGSIVYAVRITADGASDVATILAIDFASGDSRDVASVSYPRPQVGQEAALAEAQFTDDGGTIRLFWMADNTLRLWVLGAGTWTVEPTDGEVTELDGDAVPSLWSPDGRRRVGLVLSNDGTTTMRLVNRTREDLASATVDGRVSHLRWSRDGDRVVFTVGRSAPGGGVLQDLYIWDLGEGEDPAPMRITDTGAAFGAEWLGGQHVWDD